MTYIKNTWVDQEVERPKTYEITNNSDGSVTLIDSFGLVTELGTPVNADNMNHIEEGIENNDQRITVLEEEGERVNTSLSNLTPEGMDRLNQYKAVETGNISNIIEVYTDIVKYKHSTFDSSKFEVIGEPTISEDGISSGFSSTNSIKIPVVISKTFETLKFEGEAIFGGVTEKVQQLYNSNVAYRAEVSVHGDTIIFYPGTNITPAIEVSLQGYILQAGEKIRYTTEIDTKNLTQKATVIINDSQQYTKTVTFPGTYSNDFTNITISSTSYPWTGSIDLKQFSITVDGVEIFSGNKTGIDIINGIEIPYTASKTGAKIVDAQYRERVKDVYEQQGIAMYYTLDEENKNFTLPMGEIYGMLAKQIDEAHFLNYTRVTNCIKELPKGVMYDLTNGVITVKAGSICIVPFGVEDLTDTYPVGSTFIHDNFKVYDRQYYNEKFFVWVQLQNDITLAAGSSGNAVRRSIFVNLTLNVLGNSINNESGTASSSTKTRAVYYNTSTNLVGYTIDTTTTINYENVNSLPVMLVTIESGAFANIDCVFNGRGFIGSTTWIDKGLKVIAPNGRNEDGTLNNIEITTPNIAIETTTTGSNMYYQHLQINDDGTVSNAYSSAYTINYTGAPTPSTNSTVFYNVEPNKMIRRGTNGIVNYSLSFVFLGHVYRSFGDVTEFSPTPVPFQAADIHDIDGKWVYANIALAEGINLHSSSDYTIDLSSQLPDDGELYECIIIGELTSTTTAGQWLHLHVSSFTKIDLGYARCFSSGGSATEGSTANIIVSLDRRMTIARSTNYNGTASIYLRAYRKVR